MKILVFSKQNQLFKVKIQGFLLIELMISLVVFILLMFVMHRYLAMTLLLASDAHKRYEALSLLDTFIAQAHHDPSLLYKKKFEHNNIVITWVIQPFTLHQNFITKLSAAECKKIDITAVYKNSSGKQYITLSTGVKS